MKAKDPTVQVNPIDRKESLWLIRNVMKSPNLLTIGGLSLALASCGTIKNLSRPLSGGSDFDPLGSPGANVSRSLVVAPTSPSYSPGQWVETSMDNATFFTAIPSGNARADQILASGTPMKVISNKGTYVRVELDSGAVGYVPEIMIAERRSANEVPVTGPLPDLGSVPPPVEPGVISGEGIAPPPEIPGTPPPVPDVPGLPMPVPAVPDIPSVPDVAPPPEIPGITDPENID